MDELPPFAQYLESLKQWRLTVNAGLRILGILRSFMLALAVFLLWAWVKPEAWIQQIIIFFVSLIVFLILSWSRGFKKNTASEWLMALEIKHPKSDPSAFSIAQGEALDPVWVRNIEEDIGTQKEEGRRLLLAKLASLLVPALALFLIYQGAGQAWDRALHSIERAALSLSYGARLRVVEGNPNEDKAPISLSSRTQEVLVLEQNLIEINVVASPDSAPQMILKDSEGRLLQTFKLLRSNEAKADDAVGNFSLRFAQTEDAQLYLSTLSLSSPAATIKVKKLPVPRVKLSSPVREGETWSDDRPLPLAIEAEGENPLQMVQLHIKAGAKESQELVSEVLAQDKKKVTTTYSLALEPYMEQDVQDVEITAEAMDRAVPVPLVGRSRPLVIKVASAYGRYRMSLQTLREIKQSLDESLQTQSQPNKEELAELSRKLGDQAQQSPFYDALDRQQIEQMREQIQEIQNRENMPLALRTSETINRFLFEHETLDDRERDRDFYIAARTLSRVLEQAKSERRLAVPDVTQKLQDFTDERLERWKKRLARIPEEKWPETWKDMEVLPLRQGLEPIPQQDKSGNTTAAVQQLSKQVERYKQFIEQLEAREDEARKEQEQQRQQGLADAQDNLKELQRRQSQVSSKLDRASEKSAQEMGQNWASTRMDQNANIEAASKLEGQLRSLSPEAAERMQAAGEAMQGTVEAGNAEKFVEAESASDVAARLLNQAQSAAQQSQQDQQQRGRRRRVGGDQYYGNSIAGGDVDLRRSYQVNRRYREDVLDDVREIKRQQDTEESDNLLEDYLRRVIR